MTADVPHDAPQPAAEVAEVTEVAASFAPPDGWLYDTTIPEVLCVALAPDVSPAGFRSNIAVVTDRCTTTLAEYRDLTVAALPTAITGGTLVSEHAATLDGHPAHTITYTGVHDGLPLRYLATFAVHAGRAWILTFTADHGSYDRHLPAAQRAAATCRLMTTGAVRTGRARP